MENGYTESIIASNLDNIKYDTAIKQVLSSRSVLAHIIRDIVPELSVFSYEKVANELIEPDSISCEEPVSRYTIVGSATEDHTSGEGNINFDIRFNLKYPNGEGRLCEILFDIEPQNELPREYSLIKRAIYYQGRMISKQLDNLHDQRAYNQLKPVISIWICYGVAKDIQNSITEISFEQKKLFGDFAFPKSDYDIVRLLFLTIGDNAFKDEHCNETLRFLSTLMTSNLSNADKLEKLRTYIPNDKKMEEGVQAMGDFTQLWKREGKAQGANEVLKVIRSFVGGDSPAKIAEDTGLSLEEVLEYVKQSGIQLPQ